MTWINFVYNQSINQSIFRIDMLVLQSFYKFLVHSYDFRKICWPDVRRGNRFDCEYLMIWSFQWISISVSIYIYRDGAVAAASIWCVLDASCGRAGAGGRGERHEQGWFLVPQMDNNEYLHMYSDIYTWCRICGLEAYLFVYLIKRDSQL